MVRNLVRKQFWHPHDFRLTCRNSKSFSTRQKIGGGSGISNPRYASDFCLSLRNLTLQPVGASRSDSASLRRWRWDSIRAWMVSRTTEGKTMPKHHSALTIRNLRAPPTTKLARGLVELKNRDREALCKEWRRLFRRKAPLNLPQYILLRMIAYRLQANAPLGNVRITRRSRRHRMWCIHPYIQKRAAAQRAAAPRTIRYIFGSITLPFSIFTR